jgi:hypothetical protein
VGVRRRGRREEAEEEEEEKEEERGRREEEGKKRKKRKRKKKKKKKTGVPIRTSEFSCYISYLERKDRTVIQRHQITITLRKFFQLHRLGQENVMVRAQGT